MSHRETNPHFTRPLRPQHGVRMQPPDSVATPPPPQLRHPREETPPPPPPSPPHRPKQVTIKEPPLKSSAPVPPPPSRRDKPRKTKPAPPPKPQPSPRDESHVPRPTPLSQPQPQPHSRHHDPGGHRHGELRLPPQKKTKLHTWFFAVFCVIFWLVIIIGGLIVLIVYLVFRPQSPHFEVASASLNAAYLDLGYLLNADVTILANFTNPNKKVHVDFSSTIVNLYYGSTLISTQYVEPFSAAKKESRFATIRMITSQVQLPMAETQRLIKQMESNGVILEVIGVIRARSKLGSILRYSYNLYGYCSIMVTRPPGGVLIKRNCKTKR